MLCDTKLLVFRCNWWTKSAEMYSIEGWTGALYASPLDFEHPAGYEVMPDELSLHAELVKFLDLMVFQGSDSGRKEMIFGDQC